MNPKKENDMKPMISIIVPAYNNKDYIDCCINSLRKQTYKIKSVYLIATRDLSNLWLQFFLSQNQGFMRLFEKTVLK